MATLVTIGVQVTKKNAEIAAAELFELGASAVEEQEQGRFTRLVVYSSAADWAQDFAERVKQHFAELQIPQTTTIHIDPNSNWDTAWTAHLTQVSLTPRIVIQPEHHAEAAPPGTLQLLYKPDLAFGDGEHPTTRLAACAVENFCLAHPGTSVLDYGSGTGVLVFVALLSGARNAIGIDVDEVSIQAAQANARLNGLAENCRFELPPALDTAYPDTPSIGLVVANIDGHILKTLVPELARVAASAQQLLVTGFLAEQAAEFRELFEAQHFKLCTEQSEADWALLGFTKPQS